MLLLTAMGDGKRKRGAPVPTASRNGPLDRFIVKPSEIEPTADAPGKDLATSSDGASDEFDEDSITGSDLVADDVDDHTPTYEDFLHDSVEDDGVENCKDYPDSRIPGGELQHPNITATLDLPEDENGMDTIFLSDDVDADI